jgi:hypothetical protein
MDSDIWWFVAVIFIIICWAASIVFAYFVTYADVYSLSSTAAHVKDHFTAYKAVCPRYRPGLHYLDQDVCNQNACRIEGRLLGLSGFMLYIAPSHIPVLDAVCY